MGLWKDLLSLLGWEDEKPTKGRSDSSPRESSAAPRADRATVRRGVVEYVGPTFAKVQASDLKAVVFLREMADHFVNHPSEVLSEGQSVEFVVIERSQKRSDEWVASIAAVPEARSREALSNVSQGDRIDGRVAELKEQGAELDCGAFRAWVPVSEVAWGWIDHASDTLQLGERVTVEVLRVELPDGWLSDKRNRRSRAIGSLRACMPKPESPIVEMPFSSLPFKVWAVARKPRACDPVVLYVLQELISGRSDQEILTATGLPQRALDGVADILNDEGLIQGRSPTDRGLSLVQAITQARELNADPIRGLFASAAHPEVQFVKLDAHLSQPDYPRDWPRPPSNRRAEDSFTRATDEALPELLIQRIAGDGKRELLSSSRPKTPN